MSKIYNVLTANPKDHTKTLTVRGGDGASVSMRVHRFAVVGKGDRIRFGAAGSNKLFVAAKYEEESAIPLTPLFSTTDTVSIGKDKFRINIREISSDSEMRGLEFLEQFHYKTNNSLAEKDFPTASTTAIICLFPHSGGGPKFGGRSTQPPIDTCTLPPPPLQAPHEGLGGFLAALVALNVTGLP